VNHITSGGAQGQRAKGATADSNKVLDPYGMVVVEANVVVEVAGDRRVVEEDGVDTEIFRRRINFHLVRWTYYHRMTKVLHLCFY